MGFGASHARQTLFAREQTLFRGSHPESIWGYMLGALQKNRANTFHLIQRAIDVTPLEFNSAADIEKQEVTPVSRVLVTS
jgi:hypothetical protein